MLPRTRLAQECYANVKGIYLDNPARTRIPASVAEAVANYMRIDVSNMGGDFTTSLRTDQMAVKAHVVEAIDAIVRNGAGTFAL